MEFLASSTIRNSGLHRGKRGNSSTFDGRLWRMLRGDARANLIQPLLYTRAAQKFVDYLFGLAVAGRKI